MNADVDLVRIDASVPPREKDGTVVINLRTEAADSRVGLAVCRASAGGSRHDGAAHEVALRPYHSWGNRGPTTMPVWLPIGT